MRRNLQKILNFGATVLCIFSGFERTNAIPQSHQKTDSRKGGPRKETDGTWEMLKNAALVVKIGVDTAGIVVFSAFMDFCLVLTISWYFGPLQIQNENVNILN